MNLSRDFGDKFVIKIFVASSLCIPRFITAPAYALTSTLGL
jgi:hypothetical protein